MTVPVLADSPVQLKLAVPADLGAVQLLVALVATVGLMVALHSVLYRSVLQCWKQAMNFVIAFVAIALAMAALLVVVVVVVALILAQTH